MRLSLPISSFLILSLAACSGANDEPDAGPGDAGRDGGAPAEDAGPEVDAGMDAGSEADAGETDAGQADAGPSDAGPPGDAGMASVQWLTVVEPTTIDGDIALDYFYQYELLIDGDWLPYTLSLERCIAIAGYPETCSTEPLSNMPGQSGIRWGIDPSMYAKGENFYRFRLILERDGAIVSEDLLELHVTVTRCMMCLR